MSDLVVLRIEKNEKYTTISLYAAEDPRISWKAKGIHLYLYSRPDGWQIRHKDLLNRATDGSGRLGTGIRELIDCGYLKIEKLREKGKFAGSIWRVFEVPKKIYTSNEPHRKKPYAKNSDTVKPHLGKERYTNNHSYRMDHTKETTTNGVVVLSDKELLAELESMTEGTPFKRLLPLQPRFLRKGSSVVYHVLDRFTYQVQFLNWKPIDPGAVLADAIINGVNDPKGFIPFRQRRIQKEQEKIADKARVAELKATRAKKQQLHDEFLNLPREEREIFLMEAKKKLPSFIKSSKVKEDFILEEAVEQYKRRHEANG